MDTDVENTNTVDVSNNVVENIPIKNEYIDKITLELFMNKTNYNKYLSKTNPQKYNEITAYKAKLRKYSIDIIDITSQLIENPTEPINSDICELFEGYSKSIIKFIEMKKLNNANKFNDDDADEDVMFDPNNMNPEPVHNSFWSKENVIKSTFTNFYDKNLFSKR